MRKVLSFILAAICLICLVSCDKKEPENQQRVQRGDANHYLNEQETEPDISEESRLIVNGKDITDGNYVRINKTSGYAELPVIAVFKALGYDAEMQYDQNTDSYAVIVEDNTEFLNTQCNDFGFPPGVGDTDYVRRIMDNEIVIDSDAIDTVMYWGYSTEIDIDYDSNTVYINSFDPNAYVTHDARLVVNGKDITEGNSVSFKEYHNGMEVEIPLLAVVKALGAKVKWQSETVVAVKYKGETRIFDTSEDGFGVFIPIGGVVIRRIENGDLIFDLNSIEGILEEDYNVTVKVDEENYTVCIDSIK